MDFDRNEGLTDDDFYEYVNDYFHSEISLADMAIMAYKLLKNKQTSQ